MTADLDVPDDDLTLRIEAAGVMRRLGLRGPRGESMDHFPDCVVSATANLIGVAIKVHQERVDGAHPPERFGAWGDR